MRRALSLTAICLAAAFAVAEAPAPAAPPRVGAKIWIGHYAEYEEFLKTVPIERVTDVPIGVTKPKRAFFAPAGLAASGIVKQLPMSRRQGFWEAYKSEIAAYELDRLLGLDMVPVTVERRVQGDLASLQPWLEGCRHLKDVDQSTCPRPMEWAKQVCRQRVFDTPSPPCRSAGRSRGGRGATRG